MLSIPVCVEYFDWSFLARFVPKISRVALKAEILFRPIAITKLMFYLAAANRCRRRQLNASPCFTS